MQNKTIHNARGWLSLVVLLGRQRLALALVKPTEPFPECHRHSDVSHHQHKENLVRRAWSVPHVELTSQSGLRRSRSAGSKVGGWSDQEGAHHAALALEE